MKTDLEVLTGKIIRGDLTPIVYELIKDSTFISDINLYGSTREGTKDVIATSTKRDAVHDGSTRLNFKDWFANEVQPVSVPWNAKHSIGKSNRAHGKQRRNISQSSKVER